MLTIRNTGLDSWAICHNERPIASCNNLPDAQFLVNLHSALETLCKELTAPCLEFLHPRIQDAWDKACKLLEAKERENSGNRTG